MSNTFLCKVKMDNEDNRSELATILRGIADHVEMTSNTGKPIFDRAASYSRGYGCSTYDYCWTDQTH